MLWVDSRGDDWQGEALVPLLGNSGPSIARNVRVTFDPVPPATQDVKPILAILKQGIASLPPGRTMQWVLGVPGNRVDSDADIAYRVRIEAKGSSADSCRSSTCSAPMTWTPRVLRRPRISTRWQSSYTKSQRPPRN
jgi:hypothetical protein